MEIRKKKCFVIMGFGKKTDYSTGRTLDLDKTYKNIIKPAVVNAGYDCIRADEIQDSGLIDKNMYALLMHSELVIADISTYNPNAIYELGVRHAVRPFSTIVLKEKDGRIPFDLDHNRIFMYSHLGEDIGSDEAKRCQAELTALIHNISKKCEPDSPLYEYMQIVPPSLPEEVYDAIISELAEKEKHIFAVVDKAKEYMHNNDFINATKYWESACKLNPNESYFVQQLALCTYKSSYPSRHTALTDALKIIEELNPEDNTNDPETLGITGAIYKNLYLLVKDIEYINRAIKYYGKGFKVRNDYYTGENYALCLHMKSLVETDPDEKIYLQIEAKKTRKSLIETLNNIIDTENINERQDKKWIYATLAHCYYAIGDHDNGDTYENLFLQEPIEEWEKNTYNESKNFITNN